MKRKHPLKRGPKGSGIWYYRGYVVKGYSHCRNQGLCSPNLTPYEIYESSEAFERGDEPDGHGDGLRDAISRVDELIDHPLPSWKKQEAL